MGAKKRILITRRLPLLSMKYVTFCPVLIPRRREALSRRRRGTAEHNGPWRYFLRLAGFFRPVFFLARDFLPAAGLPDTPAGRASSGMPALGFGPFLDLKTEIQKS